MGNRRRSVSQELGVNESEDSQVVLRSSEKRRRPAKRGRAKRNLRIKETGSGIGDGERNLKKGMLNFGRGPSCPDNIQILRKVAFAMKNDKILKIS